MKYLALIGCATGALVATAPVVAAPAPPVPVYQANIPVGDGGTGGVCINGLRYYYMAGVGLVPLATC